VPPLSSRNSPSIRRRLSDRQRGLALVGLAAAALIGARAARRRAAGSPTDYVASIAPDAPVSMPVAPEPEAVAGPVADAPIEPAPVEAEVPVEPEAEAEPNTEELAAAEIAVLAILSQEGRLETDRTALGVATTLEREAAEVAVLLRTLHKQGHVAGDEYTAAGEKIWFVTESGTGRLD
jgi:hypothetical protein